MEIERDLKVMSSFKTSLQQLEVFLEGGLVVSTIFLKDALALRREKNHVSNG